MDSAAVGLGETPVKHKHTIAANTKTENAETEIHDDVDLISRQLTQASCSDNSQ